ncbi:MAG: RelA/SpoT AH/RIS domain-containing protein, partial [Alphaproteobacteria bacterium]
HALPASPEEGWFGLNRVAGLKFKLPGFTRRENQPVSRRAQAIPIRGIEDKAGKYAAGGALPGERIVGIMTQGEGITIYPIQSTELKNFDDEPERWLDVRWDIDAGVDARFPARIEVTATNEPGTLAQIANAAADNDANISAIGITRLASDFAVMMIDVEVFNVKHLNRLIRQVRSQSVVSGVRRVLA